MISIKRNRCVVHVEEDPKSKLWIGRITGWTWWIILDFEYSCARFSESEVNLELLNVLNIQKERWDEDH